MSFRLYVVIAVMAWMCAGCFSESSAINAIQKRYPRDNVVAIPNGSNRVDYLVIKRNGTVCYIAFDRMIGAMSEPVALTNIDNKYFTGDSCKK